MKKHICSVAILAASILFSVSCVNEKIGSDNNVQTPVETPSGKVTITASFPEVIDSKVTMVETSTGLDLKWKDTDFLTVVGNTTETFTIKAGSISEDGKTAVFEGNPVEGTSFKVILSDLGEEYSTRDYTPEYNPAKGQDDMFGNVTYDAVLENVTDYSNVSFTEEWAEKNGAKFSETGVLMLHLQLPSDFPGTRWIKFIASDRVFSDNNQASCNKSYYRRINYGYNYYSPEENSEFKAYWVSPMNEDVLPAGTVINIVMETNDGNYIKEYTLSSDFHIKPGMRNVLKLNSQNWVKKSLTWAESKALKAGWTVPYVNISATGYTPANLLDGTNNKSFGNEWLYPWDTNRCYIDKNFNDWTYTTEHSLGPDPLMKAKAPMLCIIDLGQKELIHTMKIVSRSDASKSLSTTTGEIWISVDSTNDDVLYHGNIVTANKHTEPQDGQWELWREKKWTKLTDVKFAKTTGSTENNDLTIGNIQPQVMCSARYIMLVVHEGKKGETNDIPDIGLAEFSLKYFK